MFPRGYLTYTGLIVSALGALGVAVTDEDVNTIMAGIATLAQVIGLIVAAYGRWRAGR